MSDQGSGFPPEKTMGDEPEGAAEGAWVPVIDPATELPPPAHEAQLPPPPPEAQLPPPPPAGGYPPPGSQYQAPPGPGGYVPPGQYPPPGYGPPPVQPMSSNTAATIAYLTLIPAVVFLVIEPYRRDSYVRFHAWQCILLSAVWILDGVVFRHDGFIAFMVSCLLYLLLFGFWLISIIKATKGERYHVPILGDLAEHLANTV